MGYIAKCWKGMVVSPSNGQPQRKLQAPDVKHSVCTVPGWGNPLRSSSCGAKVDTKVLRLASHARVDPGRHVPPQPSREHIQIPIGQSKYPGNENALGRPQVKIDRCSESFDFLINQAMLIRFSQGHANVIRAHAENCRRKLCLEGL